MSIFNVEKKSSFTAGGFTLIPDDTDVLCTAVDFELVDIQHESRDGTPLNNEHQGDSRLDIVFEVDSGEFAGVTLTAKLFHNAEEGSKEYNKALNKLLPFFKALNPTGYDKATKGLESLNQLTVSKLITMLSGKKALITAGVWQGDSWTGNDGVTREGRKGNYVKAMSIPGDKEIVKKAEQIKKDESFQNIEPKTSDDDFDDDIAF